MKKYLLYQYYDGNGAFVECFTSSMLVVKSKLKKYGVNLNNFGDEDIIGEHKRRTFYSTSSRGFIGGSCDTFFALYTLNVGKNDIVAFYEDNCDNVSVICGKTHSDVFYKSYKDIMWAFTDDQKEKLKLNCDALKNNDWVCIEGDNILIDLKIMSEKVNNLPDNKNYSDWCFTIKI